MKVSSLYLIITIFLLSSCKQSADKKPFWYDFKGTATLEITYSNSEKEQVYNLFAYNMFPESETTITDTIPAGSGKRIYNFPVSWPQRVTFTTSGSELTFMLLPGSKLSCNIDFTDLKKTTFSAQDSLSSVNDYLLRKDFSVSPTFKSRRTLAVQSAPNLTDFSKIMDSIYKEEQLFFNENKNKLPQWFRNYEFLENQYSDAFLRMNAITSREYFKKAQEEIPSHYFSFLDSLPVDNNLAKNFHSYYYFCWSYLTNAGRIKIPAFARK